MYKRYDDFPFPLFPAPSLARAWASVGRRAEEDDSLRQPQAVATSCCCLPPANQSSVLAAISQWEARIVARPAPPPLSRECFLRSQRQLQSRTGSRPGRSRQKFSLSGILFLESSSNNSENQRKSLIKKVRESLKRFRFDKVQILSADNIPCTGRLWERQPSILRKFKLWLLANVKDFRKISPDIWKTQF